MFGTPEDYPFHNQKDDYFEKSTPISFVAASEAAPFGSSGSVAHSSSSSTLSSFSAWNNPPQLLFDNSADSLGNNSTPQQGASSLDRASETAISPSDTIVSDLTEEIPMPNNGDADEGWTTAKPKNNKNGGGGMTTPNSKHNIYHRSNLSSKNTNPLLKKTKSASKTR
jgi:hypothetical protein